MARQITIFSSNISSKIEEAKRIASNSGVTIEGDASSGHFRGKGIKGSYTVSGSNIKVTITDKPFLIPWETVEKTIKDVFA